MKPTRPKTTCCSIPVIAEQIRNERLSCLEGFRRDVFTVPGNSEGCVNFLPVMKVAAEHHYSV